MPSPRAESGCRPFSGVSSRFDANLRAASRSCRALKRLRRQSAEVLDQRQAEHDRNGPQLADREGRDLLIGVGKTPQRFLIESARRVQDEIAGEYIHPRIAPPAAGRQRWQLFVILARQIAADFEQLDADDVVVVAQPFLRRGVGGARGALLRQAPVNLLQLGRRCAPDARAAHDGVPRRPSRRVPPRARARAAPAARAAAAHAGAESRRRCPEGEFLFGYGSRWSHGLPFTCRLNARFRTMRSFIAE